MAGPAPIEIEVYGDVQDVEGKLQRVQNRVGKFTNATEGAGRKGGSSMLGMVTKITAVVGAFKLAQKAAQLFGDAITKAANKETITAQFETILGGAKAAQDRMEELTNFAKTTPFQIGQIANASQTLETLTQGALSTGAGLRMVGDIAAAKGEDFQSLSVHVGRLYDGLQTGRAVGEAMNRLNELGIISGKTRGEIEALQKSGQKGDAVWAVAASELNDYGGAMERQSGTFNGLLSTLKGNIDDVFIAFGQPILTALKPILGEGINLAGAFETAAATAGEFIVNAARKLIQAGQAVVTLFKSGELMGVVFLALSVAFKKAINLLATGLVIGLRLVADTFVGMLAVLTTGKFWVGLFEVLRGFGAKLLEIGANFVAALIEGGMDFIEPVVSAVIYVKDKIVGAFKLAGFSLKAGMLRAAEAFLRKLEDAPLIGDGAKSLADSANREAAAAEDRAGEAYNQMTKGWEETRQEVRSGLIDLAADAREFGNAAGEVAEEQFGKGGKKIGEVFEDKYLDRMTDSISKSSPVKVLDESGDLDRLQSVLGGFFKDAEAAEETAEDAAARGKGAGGAGGVTAKTAKIVADSLSAIGGGGGAFSGSQADKVSQQLAVQKGMRSALQSIDQKLSNTGLTVSVEGGA